MQRLLFLVLLLAYATAAPLCLSGSFDLTQLTGANNTAFCNSSTSCSVLISITTDDALIADGMWPMTAQFSADSSFLTDYYPELSYVNFTCDTSTSITAETPLGPGSERLKIIWSYTSGASTDCAYILANLGNYTATQVLLAYSGNGDITSYDAMNTSSAASIADMTVQCAGNPSPSPAPSNSTTPSLAPNNGTEIANVTAPVHTHGNSSSSSSKSGLIVGVSISSAAAGFLLILLVLLLVVFVVHYRRDGQRYAGLMQ
jgi:hypothetical protein